MNFKRLAIAFSLFTFLLYATLILSLMYFYKGSLFIEILTSERTLYSVRLSIFTATIATLMSMLFAVPSAYALSRYKFFGRQFIDTILELPMIVSPVALGAMVLIFFNTPVGISIQERGMQFVFNVYGIFVAQFITTAGIAARLANADVEGTVVLVMILIGIGLSILYAVRMFTTKVPYA